MPKFTIFIRESNNKGTTYITGGEYADAETAKKEAVNECLQDWGDDYSAEDLHILGVAAGDISILEWEDLGV